MIYTDKFSSDFDSGFEEENYPTAFGITFTPQTSGITFSILGLLAALYIIFNFGITAFTNYQNLKQLEQERQQQIDFYKTRGAAQKFAQAERELKQAKVTKAEVILLFSTEQTLDTLLFDISNIASAKKVRLTSFQPQSGGTKAIEDSSLGQEVQGVLKQTTIDIVMEGSFEDTEKFLQDLERLQALLLLRNMNVSLDTKNLIGTVYIDPLNKKAKVVPGQQNKLNTSFTLKAILPLIPNELKEMAAKKTEKK